MQFLSVDAVKERVVFWQKILRLQDWQIEVYLRRKCDMPPQSPNAVGCVKVYAASKFAVVSLLDAQDFQPNDAEDVRNMDDTLVHELLHLHMEPIIPIAKMEDGSAQDIAVEQLITAVAGALSKLASCITQPS